MAKYLRELLTNYDEISVIWFDFSFPGKNGKGRDDWGSIDMLKMVRTLQQSDIVQEAGRRVTILTYSFRYRNLRLRSWCLR